MENVRIFPTLNFPWSGDVTQDINRWTDFLNGNQFSLFSLNLGRSPAPEIEQKVLEDVASYGRQLGRIGEAMLVLMDHFEPKQSLGKDEQKALADLRAMLTEIAGVKERCEKALATRQPAA